MQTMMTQMTVAPVACGVQRPQVATSRTRASAMHGPPYTARLLRILIG